MAIKRIDACTKKPVKHEYALGNYEAKAV